MIATLLLAAAVQAAPGTPLTFSCTRPCGAFACIVPCPEKKAGAKHAKPPAAQPDDPIGDILRNGPPDDRPVICNLNMSHCWRAKRPLVAPPAVEL